MTPPTATRLTIHGRVQGVFFRDTLRQLAAEHGVSGWARNREDGAVEAQLEGPEAAVDELIEFCRQGPPRATVERIEVTEAQAEVEPGGDPRAPARFEVR